MTRLALARYGTDGQHLIGFSRLRGVPLGSTLAERGGDFSVYADNNPRVETYLGVHNGPQGTTYYLGQQRRFPYTPQGAYQQLNGLPEGCFSEGSVQGNRHPVLMLREAVEARVAGYEDSRVKLTPTANGFMLNADDQLISGATNGWSKLAPTRNPEMVFLLGASRAEYAEQEVQALRQNTAEALRRFGITLEDFEARVGDLVAVADFWKWFHLPDEVRTIPHLLDIYAHRGYKAEDVFKAFDGILGRTAP